jgi:hypothetical protein
MSSGKDGPLSIPLSQLENDLKVNIMSLYGAGSEAVKGFETLPEDVSKTFVFVGNKQSHGFIYPPLVSLGMGKAAAAYLIGSSAAEYSKKGFKYVDPLGVSYPCFSTSYLSSLLLTLALLLILTLLLLLPLTYASAPTCTHALAYTCTQALAYTCTQALAYTCTHAPAPACMKAFAASQLTVPLQLLLRG